VAGYPRWHGIELVRGTLGKRLDFLIEQTGKGRMVGAVEVDQVYAHYQHEGDDFEHPDGGQAHYLRDPLFSNSEKYVRNLANGLVDHEGSRLHDAMVENMEHLSDQVEILAPREFDDLAKSGHPTVTEEGKKTYDRPPRVARLTEDELKLKSRISRIVERGRYARRR